MNDNSFPPSVQKVLKEFNLQQPILLGKGGEGWVFELDQHRVLKIYNPVNLDYLKSRLAFEKLLSEHQLPYDLPEIYEIGSVDETHYSIDKKLKGVTLDKVFSTLQKDDQYKVLKNYFQSLKALHAIQFQHLPFGQVIECADYTTSDSWQDFLIAKMNDKINYGKAWMSKDVDHFDQKVEHFYEIIRNNLHYENKTLVHGDYYYGNVMGEGTNISAVFDFSPLTVIGDFRMDIAGAIQFCELSEMFTSEHIDYLKSLAEEEYGKEIGQYIDYYTLYYSFYFSNSWEFDEKLYGWCIKNLNNKDYW